MASGGGGDEEWSGGEEPVVLGGFVVFEWWKVEDLGEVIFKGVLGEGPAAVAVANGFGGDFSAETLVLVKRWEASAAANDLEQVFHHLEVGVLLPHSCTGREAD